MYPPSGMAAKRAAPGPVPVMGPWAAHGAGIYAPVWAAE
jgi:hypothetical protein